MAWTPITGIATQYSNRNNGLANDYWLKFYDTSNNPLSVAVDKTGSPTLAKVKLNVEGYPITDPLDDDTVFIPHVDQEYRVVLYRSEADADNNDTADVPFNISNIQTDIAQLATSEDISMKGTDLQTVDDYDRSPLFVDGEDFTAGAGPHVITVPSDWTPSNSDMRFYKLDSSGIVTDLTPTSTDATTFTLAETLLSTDTIFIGDDTFRNQNDGDPADIRTRLDVYSTAETDTFLDAKQDNPATITGFSGYSSGYVKASKGFMDVDTNITKGIFETVGPTGSGADYEWSQMDDIPLTAIALHVTATAQVDSTAAADVGVWVENDVGRYIAFNRLKLNSASIERVFASGSNIVDLDSSNRFDIKWNSVGTATSEDIILYLNAYYGA